MSDLSPVPDASATILSRPSSVSTGPAGPLQGPPPRASSFSLSTSGVRGRLILTPASLASFAFLPHAWGGRSVGAHCFWNDIPQPSALARLIRAAEQE